MSAAFSFVLLTVPFMTSCGTGGGGASGSSGKSSEMVIRRVDSNQLIRLRIFLDGKSQGALKVGETAVYKIKNGYHTVRVGFEDFQARSSEVAQFTAYNSTHVFSVTDTSIVLVSEEPLSVDEYPGAGGATPGSVIAGSARGDVAEASIVIDTSVRAAFDKVTKNIKKNRKIAIINVDADNIHEANFVLEELTLLSVNSPKKFNVIDRRIFDAYRAKNSIGLPSYENDFLLRYVGALIQADYVLSGRIDGPGDLRRLRVKALDVSTGHLVGDASERM
jgi:hypothetical protein